MVLERLSSRLTDSESEASRVKLLLLYLLTLGKEQLFEVLDSHILVYFRQSHHDFVLAVLDRDSDSHFCN